MHELHVWTPSFGVNAMSIHVVLTDGATHDDVLTAVRPRVTKGLPITHATMQIEAQGRETSGTHL